MTSVLSQSGLQTLEGSSLGASASQTQLYNKGKLTEEGRKRLLAIKQREELKNHLVTKFEQKYGEKKPPTAPKSAQSALGASQSLSGTTPAAVASPTAASGAAKPNFELSMKDPHAEPIPSPERRRITRVSSSMPATGEWAEMSEHNRKNFNLFEETEKELKKETQKRIKKDLDEQLHAIEERKKCGGIDWNTIDRERVMKDVDAYHAEEKKKTAERKAFLIGDRDIRAQQIRDTIIRRQQEKERNLREEERLVLRVQAEIEAEKQRVKAIKEAGLEAVKTVMVENMRQRAIKDEIKRKDEEHSMKLQKQYIAMLEKQERDRHAAMQNILEMQERSQAIYSASVGATLSGQAAEDEARAAQTQAEFNRARTEKDKEKAKERLAMEQAVQDSLFEQIQARARVAKEEKERNDSYSKNIQEAMAKMALAEEAAKIERARMAAKTKKDLDDQMADIIKRRSEDLNMSKHERLLNAKIMQKVRAGEMDVKFDKEQFERTGISWMALKRASPF